MFRVKRAGINPWKSQVFGNSTIRRPVAPNKVRSSLVMPCNLGVYVSTADRLSEHFLPQQTGLSTFARTSNKTNGGHSVNRTGKRCASANPASKYVYKRFAGLCICRLNYLLGSYVHYYMYCNLKIRTGNESFTEVTIPGRKYSNNGKIQSPPPSLTQGRVPHPLPPQSLATLPLAHSQTTGAFPEELQRWQCHKMVKTEIETTCYCLFLTFYAIISVIDKTTDVKLHNLLYYCSAVHMCKGLLYVIRMHVPAGCSLLIISAAFLLATVPVHVDVHQPVPSLVHQILHVLYITEKRGSATV